MPAADLANLLRRHHILHLDTQKVILGCLDVKRLLFIYYKTWSNMMRMMIHSVVTCGGSLRSRTLRSARHHDQSVSSKSHLITPLAYAHHIHV